MRNRWLIVAAIMTLSQNAPGQESRPALPPAPPPPGMPAADDPDRDKPQLALNIPQVILPDDLDRYSRMLGLSQEQRSAFERIYIAYREDSDRFNLAHMPPIVQLSLKCGSESPDKHNWNWFNDYQDFLALQRRFVKEQFAREDAMFAELIPLLTEQQVPKLTRVQMLRQRTRWINFSMIPGAHIDLTSMIEAANLPDDVLEAIDPTLAEYEIALTPAMLKLQRIDDMQMADLVRLTVQLFFEVDGTKVDQHAPGFAERFQAILDDRARLLAKSARAQRQIAEINEQFAPRVFELIPEPLRASVSDAYLRRMHPFVYPDNCDPKSLFDEILKADGLETEVREALQVTLEGYRESYNSLTRQMIEATEKTEDQRARMLPRVDESSLPEWKLRTERWDKGIEFIDSVLGQLPSDLQTSFAARVEDYKLRTETFRAHAEHRPLNPKIYPPQKSAAAK